jgi:hypothetical protein
MSLNKDRAGTFRLRGGAGGVVAIALAVGGLGLTGCSIVKAVKTIAHNIESNKATMDAFTSKMQSGEATPFEATYVTTGSSPATVVYAVQPPKNLAFKDTASGGSGSSGNGAGVDIIVNSSGEYACTPPSSGSGSSSVWSCDKLPAADAAQENEILGFYTPAHWVTFLRDFSLAAGFAGDKVTSSNMTVNGFSMNCVDFRAPGVPGTSTICTTSQGILGYVKVAADSTSFEIKTYSASPQTSLFQLPPGAKVTVITTTTTTTG